MGARTAVRVMLVMLLSLMCTHPDVCEPRVKLASADIVVKLIIDHVTCNTARSKGGKKRESEGEKEKRLGAATPAAANEVWTHLWCS